MQLSMAPVVSYCERYSSRLKDLAPDLKDKPFRQAVSESKNILSFLNESGDSGEIALSAFHELLNAPHEYEVIGDLSESEVDLLVDIYENTELPILSFLQDPRSRNILNSESVLRTNRDTVTLGYRARSDVQTLLCRRAVGI